MGGASETATPPAIEQAAKVAMKPAFERNAGIGSPAVRLSKITNAGITKKLKTAGATPMRAFLTQAWGSERGAFGGEYGLVCIAR